MTLKRPNRLFTTGQGAENHRRVERESVHTFYAFDAAINSYKKRSAGGVLNRADVGDLTSRENGEIDCSRTQGDGTRHKPKGFRAKRRPPTGQGERVAAVRGMRSRSLAPTSKPGGRRRDAASGPTRGARSRSARLLSLRNRNPPATSRGGGYSADEENGLSEVGRKRNLSAVRSGTGWRRRLRWNFINSNPESHAMTPVEAAMIRKTQP